MTDTVDTLIRTESRFEKNLHSNTLTADDVNQMIEAIDTVAEEQNLFNVSEVGVLSEYLEYTDIEELDFDTFIGYYNTFEKLIDVDKEN